MDSLGPRPKKPVLLLHPPPVRILVQTMTHLVPADGVNTARPGDKYSSKLFSMINRICRHHWDRDYTPGVHRWYTHGADFGYNHRICFFLIDYGTTSNNGDVPIVCYEWTGEVFKTMPELLKSKKVQRKLKDVPFTPVSRKPLQRPSVRSTIKTRLRRTELIPNQEIEHLSHHPEDMEWLQRKFRSRPRFWWSLLAQIEERERKLYEREEVEMEYAPSGYV